MNRILFAVFLSLFFFSTSQSQNLYTRAYGIPGNTPVIFVHGGPGSSSVYFEATTAAKLAAEGFYVIVYDRRGEGRSKDAEARMNFEEAIADIEGLYTQYGLTKASFIAFSFGGLVTTLFADHYPEKVRSILYVSALIDQQGSYNTILRSCTDIYTRNGDTAGLSDLQRISQLDTNTLAYRTDCFEHATKNGFFKLEQPNALAQSLYASYSTDPLITHYVKNTNAVATFWRNEPRKNIDLRDTVVRLRTMHIPVFGLYGRQDGIYSPEQVMQRKQWMGDNHVKYLDNCSHTLFVDQQEIFLASAKEWLR